MMVLFNESIDDALVARPPMTQVTLSSKYQIVIPEDVRKTLPISPGQRFDVFVLGGELRVVPVMDLKDAFGSAPGIDTSDPRDHQDRV